MIITITLLSGILTVLLGRWMFGRWFNHVGVYGIIWGFSLALFHVGLIRYYPLEAETWMVIVAGWMAFVLGSASVVVARYALRNDVEKKIGRTPRISENEHPFLLRTLWIVNSIVMVVGLHELYVASKLLGSVSNIFVLGNVLYKLRIHEGLPGVVPYLDSLTFTACLLAGLYTSAVGRLRLVGSIPLIGLFMISIANMSRALIIIGAILFMSGYFSGRGGLKQKRGTILVSRFKRALSIICVAAALISVMEFVRGNRAMTESFAGATTTLKRLNVNAMGFLTPSVVMYITAHYGVLNQYLKKDTEHPPIGHYTLAPLWRVLSKLGFDTYVAQAQPFYNTPVQANTATYLRELHADYGVAGVVIGPFLLGLAASVFWLRYEHARSLVDLTILGHIYVVIGMTSFFLGTQLGSWLASLIFGLTIAFIYSLGLRRRTRLESFASI